jgi:hypothetical protein
MARFGLISKGTQARKTVQFLPPSVGEVEAIPVDLRVLTSDEEMAAQAAAHKLAKARGLDDPKEGQPVFDLALMAYVVLTAAIDHDSAPAHPQPFFDTIDQVLSLDRDRLALLYEAQEAFQQEVSPRQLTFTTAEYISLISLAANGEAADTDPFFAKLPRATLVNLLRITARQLAASQTHKSPSSSSTSTVGESG